MGIGTNPISNADLARRAIGYLGDRDYQAFYAICDPNIMLDMPYHPLGAKMKTGVDPFVRENRALKVFDSFRLDVVDVFDTGGDTVILECRSQGQRKDGDWPPYANHYLFVLVFADGKLVCWREFYNPLEAMKQGYAAPRLDRAEG